MRDPGTPKLPDETPDKVIRKSPRDPAQNTRPWRRYPGLLIPQEPDAGRIVDDGSREGCGEEDWREEDQ